jgi:hypothetical protein
VAEGGGVAVFLGNSLSRVIERKYLNIAPFRHPSPPEGQSKDKSTQICDPHKDNQNVSDHL